MIDIIMVNYNSDDELKKLIPTLEKHTKDYRLTIVDNASKDTTYLKTLDDKAQVIYNDENLGYAAGVNIGMRATENPYAVFVNPDCRVTVGWLEGLVGVLKSDAKIAATGPMLYDDKNSEYAGNPTYVPLSLTVDMEVNWVSGAVFCVNRKAWEEIGEFREEYFFMWEETDWCQIAVNKGYKIRQAADSIVIHAGGESCKGETAFFVKHYQFGKNLFYKRHPKSGKKRVLIATPSYGDVKAQYHINYMNLLVRLMKLQFTEEEYEFFPLTIYNQFVYDARNKAVETAQSAGCDYIFFIDADMIVPPDTFERLVAHDKECVGCLAFKRAAPYLPLVYRLEETTEDGRYRFGIRDDWPKNELTKVDAIGGACFLVKTSVFDKLERPYFYIKENTGEDIWFSILMIEKEIPMYVDTGAPVGHLGEIIVGEDTYRGYKAQMEAHRASILGEREEDKESLIGKEVK